MRTENSNPKITIIGSGAGAGALVNTLIKNGFKPSEILILERGDELPKEEYSSAATRFIETYENAGAVPCMGKPIIPFALASCVGGGPEINGALIWKTPNHIKKAWFENFNLPFNEEMFENNLNLFNTFLEVKDSHINEDHDYASFLLKKASNTLNINCVPAKRAIKGSCCSDNLCAFGSTNDSKQTINKMIFKKYIQLGLFLEKKIKDIKFDISKRSGPYKVNYLKDNIRKCIETEKLFICAGTINSPLILTDLIKVNSSKFKIKFHINLKSIGLRKIANPDKPGTMFSAQVQEYQKDNQYIMPFNWQYAHLASILDRHKPEIDFNYVFKHGMGLTTQVSQMNIESDLRVVKICNRNYKILTHTLNNNLEVQKAIHNALQRTYKIYESLGIENILAPIKNSPILKTSDLLNSKSPKLKNLDMISVHHMGTLPLDSKYIERNGSIRGLSNIYIADGSLLPTAVGESPQLTIMAFVSSLYSNIRP